MSLVKPQKVSTKVKSTLGLACAIHCITVPFLVAFLPGIFSSFFSHPVAEIGLLMISGYFLGNSFISDFRIHRSFLPLLFAISGFGLLVTHQFLGHNHELHLDDLILPVVSAVLIIVAYFLNWKISRTYKSCELHDHA